MPVELLVFLIVFSALLIQSLAGFGSALMAMPLLAQILGVPTAAPLFAVCALIGEIILITRLRKALRFAAMWRLIAGAVVAIPIGILGADLIPQQIALVGLGIVTFGFALYSLVGPEVPAMPNPRWAFGFGFVSGLLSGAYNTGGPPYVIYGATQRWEQREFKANIQGVFMVSSVMVTAGHVLSGGYTPEVLRLLGYALPAIALGLGVGFVVEPYISPTAFRRAVLVLLLVLGLSLIF
jgi:hypothetical protein